jgi:hypothetical protein
MHLGIGMRDLSPLITVLLILVSGSYLESCVSERNLLKAMVPEPNSKDPPPLDSHTLWIGHDVSELRQEFGKPDAILEARPKRGTYRNGIPAYAVIYSSHHQGKCIDAYVVAESTGKILRYYCR